MKLRLLPLLISSLLASSAALCAEDETSTVDMTLWKCKYCAFEEGTRSGVEAGVGYVSEDSFRFGEYTGLHEKGAYLIGTAESRYRNPESASYGDVSVSDVGLETRAFELQGGTQGLYRISLQYNELPHYISDSSRTPFLGSGADRLTLPAAWVPAGTTTGMTALAGSLDDVDLETKRSRLGLAAMFIPARNWETSVNYRRETREGKRRIAGTFQLSSAELVQPIDYTTDLVDVAASYSGKSWQTKLAYHGSTFQNGNESLVWQNPYSPIVAGATEGELALAPDNQFHQVLASLAYHISNTSHVMADLAVGRMTQNQDYVAATRNALLAVGPLPTASLDGRVDTTNASIKWTGKLSESLNMKADYRYSDRDNKTAQHSYDWVVTDYNTTGPRTNLPYSFTSNTFRASVEHRTLDSLKTSLGYDRQDYDRSYQSVEQSQEQTVWVSVAAHPQNKADLTFRLAHSEREKDGYVVVPEVDNPENPLLKKYNLADRDRDVAGIRMDAPLTKHSSVGLSVGMAKDDYPDSVIGLTSSQEFSAGIDFSAQLSKHTSLSAFFSNENIKSSVSGSQLYSLPDWSGDMDDSFSTVGAGVRHMLIEKKLELGADYAYTRSRGSIRTIDGGVESELPDLRTELNSIKLYGNYRFSENLILNGAYWHERYSSSLWAFDDVLEDTVTNNLSLGQEAPDYSANVVMFSLRYHF